MISLEREIQIREQKRAFEELLATARRVHRETENSVKSIDNVYAKFKEDIKIRRK